MFEGKWSIREELIEIGELLSLEVTYDESVKVNRVADFVFVEVNQEAKLVFAKVNLWN